jgi:hypothetical protein
MSWETWDASNDNGGSPSDSGNGTNSGDQGAPPDAPAPAYSGQQHTADLAAAHGIGADHLVSSYTTTTTYTPPPAPTAPTPGVKQATVPAGGQPGSPQGKQSQPPKAKQAAERIFTRPARPFGGGKGRK